MPKPNLPAGAHKLMQHQRGAVVIMTAGFMLLGVLFLALVIDTGRLYMEKRDLQRIADIAALEAASRDGCKLADRNNVKGKWRQEIAQEAATRNGFDGIVVANCGDLIGGSVRGFSLNEGDGIAVRVRTSVVVPASLIAGGLFKDDVNLSAVSVALRGGSPLAGLTIRSQTLTIDTEQSQLLNGVLGGLLGTSLNVSALGYNSLLGTNVKTLDFLDALSTELNLTVGDREEVLTTQLTIGQFLTATIAAISRLGGDVLASGLPNIANTLSALNIFALTNNPATFTLAELLSIQTTTEQTAALVETNLFDLVKGSIQLVSEGSVANVNLPINLFGLANASVKVKVIEPAQVSAVGDPRDIDASLGVNDPNAIFVRTAQVRSLINLDLSGVVNVTSGLLGAVSGALSPLVSFLNSNGFNLITGLGNLLSDVFSLVLTICNNDCTPANVLEARGGAIQIGLDVGGAKAYVSDYSCSASKSLAVEAMTEVGHLYVGKVNESDLFSPTINPVVGVAPAPLIEIGYKQVRPKKCLKVLGIGSCEDLQWLQTNNSWKTDNGKNNAKANAKLTVIVGLGVTADSPIGNSSRSLNYVDPPDLGTNPDFQGISGDDFVGSLTSLLSGLEVKAYSNSGGLLGGLLTNSFNLLDSLLAALDPVLATLSSVLDPLVNSLLNALGVNVADADVGANLTCGSNEGVRLVN